MDRLRRIASFVERGDFLFVKLKNRSVGRPAVLSRKSSALDFHSMAFDRSYSV
jgi:hypothetical protein